MGLAAVFAVLAPSIQAVLKPRLLALPQTNYQPWKVERYTRVFVVNVKAQRNPPVIISLYIPSFVYHNKNNLPALLE